MPSKDSRTNLVFLKQRRLTNNITIDTIISCQSDHFQYHHCSYLSFYTVVDDVIGRKYGCNSFDILTHKLRRSSFCFAYPEYIVMSFMRQAKIKIPHTTKSI